MRIERGMTQQQLADLCQMHRTFIISIEKGRQNASALTLVRLAAALGVLPAELFRAFTKHVMRSVRMSDACGWPRTSPQSCSIAFCATAVDRRLLNQRTNHITRFGR